MRVSLPTPDELQNIRRRYKLAAQFNPIMDRRTPYDGHAGQAARPQMPLLGPATPAALADVEAQVAPSPWNSDEHVREFLQGQQREAFFDAYTRVTMIVGVNQLLQALSYYLIGLVANGSPTGALVCAVGIQSLAILLLRLDVDNVSMLDILCVVLTYMMPPLIAGLVIILESPEAPQRLTIIVTLSFIMHTLWIFYMLKQIEPTRGVNGKRQGPQKFHAVCQILDTDAARSGTEPKPLPWLVTKRFFVMIAAMWVISIAMNLAWIFGHFEGQ